METDKNMNNDFPLAEILLRLPIRSIAKFKSVCKQWKLLIESPKFRSLFMSLHKTSSCSWSLLSKKYPLHRREEHIALYGCKRWGLPRSLSSYILSPPILDSSEFDLESFDIRASASGLLLIRILDSTYYVGNPLLRKWVKVRPCTLSLENYYYSNMCGLATCIENDVVLGYKVILGWTKKFQEAKSLSFQVYSSETGKWTCEHIRCPCPFGISWEDDRCGTHPISLNGMVHWIINDNGFILVLDLYNEGADHRCHVVSFPRNKISSFDNCYPKLWSRCACTTSGGFIMYIDAITIYEDHRLKVWKLTTDSLRWELSWEINLTHIEFGITSSPLAMHPFDTDILYLVSREKKCMMLINLRTQKSMLHKDSEEYCDDYCNISIFKCPTGWERIRTYWFWQFVPSPWMDDVPCPPPCPHCGRP